MEVMEDNTNYLEYNVYKNKQFKKTLDYTNTLLGLDYVLSETKKILDLVNSYPSGVICNNSL